MGAWTEIAVPTGLTETITGLTNGTSYRIQVRAIGDGINYSNSPWSPARDATPARPPRLPTPTGLDTEVDDGEITLTWNDVIGEQSYRVEVIQGTSFAQGGTQSSVGAGIETFTFTSLANDVLHSVRVQARGDEINRWHSEWAETTAVPTAPPDPQPLG